MREHKDSDSPSGYTRDVYRKRPTDAELHDGVFQMPPAGVRSLPMIGEAHRAFGARLTRLNDENVRAGGCALSLEDPRDLLAQIEGLVGVMRSLGGALGNVESLGAQVTALWCAQARVDELRVETGDAA